jgi:hypothetical protein
MNQSAASFNALLSSVRSFLLIAGSLLAANGLASSGLYFWVQLVAGSVVGIGSAAWGVYAAFMNWRRANAVGVAAGINLTVSGKALAADGKTVVSENNGATPPLDVTIATAQEITAKFGPPATSIAKS